LEKKPIQNYSKYAGMAFQLLSAILFGTFLGQWADKKMANTTPYLSALGALIGISAGLYVSLKDILKQSPPNKKKDGIS
jgi:F0F1-type ATP synthase assembly protein I